MSYVQRPAGKPRSGLEFIDELEKKYHLQSFVCDNWETIMSYVQRRN